MHTANAPTAGTASGRGRLESIDVLSGVIVIIVALDHTRDFFGRHGQNPTNLARASAALFLTRWITFFCAPVFFLLTGTGAYLSLRRRSPGELSRFLLTRGLWLIFLEVVVLRCFAYQFNFDHRVAMMLVLWALAWAMITLSALVRLPSSVVTALGVIVITVHNVLDSVKSKSSLWSVLRSPGSVVNTPSHVVLVAYPLIPGIGVTAVGYGLGQVYSWDPERRRAFLLRLGLTLAFGFLVIRGINTYGDPSHWMRQKTAVFTVLSFLNTTKYPPSLSFLLMALGPSMIFLSFVDRGAPRILRPARTIGKVPLFYYMLHFPLIHLLAAVTCYMRYGSAHRMLESPDLAHFPFTGPPGWGLLASRSRPDLGVR
ncbi:MAG: DUF1624 domain-containing protein [Gemmatimonadaceae bacterium]